MQSASTEENGLPTIPNFNQGVENGETVHHDLLKMYKLKIQKYYNHIQFRHLLGCIFQGWEFFFCCYIPSKDIFHSRLPFNLCFTSTCFTAQVAWVIYKKLIILENSIHFSTFFGSTQRLAQPALSRNDFFQTLKYPMPN